MDVLGYINTFNYSHCHDVFTVFLDMSAQHSEKYTLFEISLTNALWCVKCSVVLR